MRPSSKVWEVGKSHPRADGRGRVTGEARFTDDLPFPDAWFGATVRSPYPAASISGIDLSAAKGVDPDVVILTAADLPGPNVVRLIEDDWPVLASERVCHVGEAVAIVAAPSRARARAAAETVVVEYDVLPAVLSLDDALAGDPRNGGERLILARVDIEHGDVDAAFAAADHVIEGVYETGHQEHIYIEPQAMVASPLDDGSVELIGSMQCPYYVQKALAHLLGEDPDRVRIRQAETGGGFGGKEDYPDMIGAHAALLAREVGRPVKFIYDRHEDIVATTKRHPSRVRHRTGVTRDGRLVAVDIEVLFDGGAYTTLSPVVLSRGVIHAAGPYVCPDVRIRGSVLATNTVPNGAFRGFGAPQTQFAAERQMDRIARELGLDPFTIRERNAYRTGDETPTGQCLDQSVSAIECLREATERTDFVARWKQYESDRSSADPKDRAHRGIGLSLVWHGAGFTGNGEQRMLSPATVAVGRSGGVEIRVAATDFGQGTGMVLSQIVADAVGVSVGEVSAAVPDTAQVPDSGPTVASRTVMVVGRILERAGAKLAERLLDHAAGAHQLERESLSLARGELLSDGEFVETFAEVAERYVAEHGELVVTERFEAGIGQTFDETTYRGAAYAAYGWACDVVELEVDDDTLSVSLKKATLAYDVGKAIHPVQCKGQIEGGTLQALGHGFLEEIKLQNGAYMNDRLATYIIPTIQDTPDMDVVLIENASSSGPAGAKGVGEIPMDGGAAAVLSAIENATGIFANVVPATPERLLEFERDAMSSGEDRK